MNHGYSWRDRAHSILRWIPGTIEYKLRKAAARVEKGHVVAIPSQSVYTFCTDGSQEVAVKKLNRIKDRPLEQRGGVIVASVERVLDKIDFEVLKEIGCSITPESINRFFEISYGGMVVPCKKDAFPSHLTIPSDFEVDGTNVPTILLICNMDYGPWRKFERELTRFPKVIWVGSSANITNEQSLSYDQICCHPRLQEPELKLGMRIRDRSVEEYPFPGSYPLVSLLTNPPIILRYGNMVPETHPEVYRAWDEDVFRGRLQYRTKVTPE